ncbi:MAG: ZIP family metal transporter, partial [Acidobacteriota bacterium]|nr:ZIP family metal transporter [Acidobacteriota bacterium]
DEEALAEARTVAMEAHIVDFGLSLHSAVLGITLGLIREYASVRVLFIAVAFDQFADGVSVGATLSESALLTTWHTAILRAVFSLACPIGITIGVSIDAAGGAADQTVQGVFAAFGAGMLLVIAFTNMLPVLTKPFDALAECCVHENHDADHHGGAVPHRHATGTPATKQAAGDDEATTAVEVDSSSGDADGSQPLTVLWRISLYICVALGIAAMAIIAKWG